jgi:hypothetical protein
MSNAACIGGLVLKSNKSIRLLQADGRNHPSNTDYDIGQVWDLDYRPLTSLRAPHLEDVTVLQRKYKRHLPSLRTLLLERIHPWRGSPQHLYDGLIRATTNGSGYICARVGVPGASTGYWLAGRPLTTVDLGKKFVTNILARVGCGS